MGRREKGELLRYEGCSHIYNAAFDASIMRQSRALGEHNNARKDFSFMQVYLPWALRKK